MAARSRLPALQPGRSSGFGQAIATLLAVGVVDYSTGTEFGFYVFYFIPIALTAWRIDLRGAVWMCLAATAVWYAVDTLSGHLYSSEWFRVWNSCVRLASFVAIGVTVARTRASLDRERALNLELNRSLAEVRQLSGLLPICASCKKIRNDEGYWERVEKYITDRTEAAFTHSICPVCLEQLYPDGGAPGEEASGQGEAVAIRSGASSGLEK